MIIKPMNKTIIAVTGHQASGKSKIAADIGKLFMCSVIHPRMIFNNQAWTQAELDFAKNILKSGGLFPYEEKLRSLLEPAISKDLESGIVIIDGMPRTVDQAIWLCHFNCATKIIFVNAAYETRLNRFLKRKRDDEDAVFFIDRERAQGKQIDNLKTANMIDFIVDNNYE